MTGGGGQKIFFSLGGVLSGPTALRGFNHLTSIKGHWSIHYKKNSVEAKKIGVHGGGSWLNLKARRTRNRQRRPACRSTDPAPVMVWIATNPTGGLEDHNLPFIVGVGTEPTRQEKKFLGYHTSYQMWFIQRLGPPSRTTLSSGGGPNWSGPSDLTQLTRTRSSQGDSRGKTQPVTRYPILSRGGHTLEVVRNPSPATRSSREVSLRYNTTRNPTLLNPAPTKGGGRKGDWTAHPRHWGVQKQC